MIIDIVDLPQKERDFYILVNENIFFLLRIECFWSRNLQISFFCCTFALTKVKDNQKKDRLC